MGKITLERFGSISQLMSTLKSRQGKVNEGMRGENSSETSTEKFSGTKSYDEACDQLLNGWDKHLNEIKKGFNEAVRVNANTTTQKTRVSAGVVGYAPLVPNAIRGLPNSMITTERIPQKVKAVTIVYNTSVSSHWTTDEMVKCGIAVMKLVNKLELDGYRVKLSVEAMSTTADRDQCRMIVDVKDWKQPLDLKKLCFPMVSPSMLRRIGFRWLETVPNMTNRGFSGGYGTPLCSERGYQKNLESAREAKVIGDNEYYLTAYMVKENNHDIAKIMEQAGMSSLNK